MKKLIRKLLNLGNEQKPEPLGHPEKFKNFDRFLYSELIDYLLYIREFMYPQIVTAELLAKTDALIFGFTHALQMSTNHNVYCDCCLYWCAGSNCQIVQEAWQLFLDERSDLNIVYIKTDYEKS